MPCGFVDDPEGDVADEEVDDGGFGDDIFAADADGIDVLLLNVGQHYASAVTDDLRRGIDDKGVGCVPESLLHVLSERLLAVIRKGDIALCDGDGVHGLTVQQHLPLPGFGARDPHGDLLSPFLYLLSAIKKLRSDQGGHPQFLFILCTVFGRCTVKNRSTAMSCVFLTLRVALFAENLLNRITSGRYFFLSLFVG